MSPTAATRRAASEAVSAPAGPVPTSATASSSGARAAVERLRPRYSGLLGRPLMLGNSVDVLDNPYA